MQFLWIYNTLNYFKTSNRAFSTLGEIIGILKTYFYIFRKFFEQQNSNQDKFLKPKPPVGKVLNIVQEKPSTFNCYLKH